MYKFFVFLVLIIWTICIIILNSEVPYLNSITSFDDDRYHILYSYAAKKVKINGNYVEPNFDSKYYCYLKDDIKNSVLVTHVKTYKELNGKLYLIGTNPFKYTSSDMDMEYTYFVLNYYDDELYEYSNFEEMPQSVRTIFEENIN